MPSNQGLHCLPFIIGPIVFRSIFSHIKRFSFFFFFFDLGFTALSRIFHLYRADRSSKVGENRSTRRKTTWPSVSRTWLSHIWPELGSNHSGEKSKGFPGYPYLYFSQRTTKPTISLVRPAKTQINLHIRTVWSESSLIAYALYSSQAIQREIYKNSCYTGWSIYIWASEPQDLQ